MEDLGSEEKHIVLEMVQSKDLKDRCNETDDGQEEQIM